MQALSQLHLPKDRNERLAYLRRRFPECTGTDAMMPGGRVAALAALDAVKFAAYGKTRNHLDGDVSRLSPYFRHGVLTLKEAAAAALAKSGGKAYKFVFELAWRDFWRRVWWQKGDAIRNDLEPAKVALGNAALPADIVAGTTGLKCMDTFVQQLRDDGYVHNHGRMWFAAYVVHWRKVRWQDAADWYYQELLDGDWASNHLSWQWIASTFSSKPYFFNKENLVNNSNGKLCMGCKAKCPFDASYEELEERLFSNTDVRK